MCCAPSLTPRMWETVNRAPLVDEEWHAICQAIYNGVERPEWQNTYYKNVEMRDAEENGSGVGELAL